MPDYVLPQREPVLEPAARELAEATAFLPFPFDLGPVRGRKALEKAQSGALGMPEMDDRWVAVSGGPKGSVAVRILHPRGVAGTLPATLYIHGAGWVFGSAHTHDRLVRELAVGARTALVFPEYTLSPEARYPVALEECYAVARWLTSKGAEHGIDPERLAVAGDSVGGNMAAALTLLAKERGDVSFIQQVLFYPVTDASFGTGSYHRFAEGYLLRRDVMQWFWDQYTTDEAHRAEITASPLRATEEQLTGLPPALVITAEADIVRDEGEAYAAKLRAAGVAVTATRYSGTTHDFVMLNALSSTQAARGAIAEAIATLRQALGTDV
ncbi:alpha/beta hydrolase [Streptomyces sp. NBC_01763]|uniref:alpha/beta hydrolase n=1 Tax=Streptomyces sp. NBC_01763 TaxID=2975934 RepID=UPI002DDB0600|nr:alpha/beta hydrolase [Streptomyces sp. NBC_01763]WSC34256.1 alpha/beta hydrolase [Streptomyces sp. NBC_01763]WSC41805.1 alpha/beta hydrolase [Streptomyces sp. NBC_01763]